MMLEGKRVVITGGTGSMGKTLVRRILGGEMGVPEKVIVFSRDEGKQHYMRLAYQNREVSTDEIIFENFKRVLEFRIGDVRSYADVCSVLRDVDIVINAAALKQVPTCEYFPDQAVSTNCLGAQNIVRAITENKFNVDTVVGVSTDKAVKPVNVMGMTKAIMERIINSGNIMNQNTRFLCVRYGNVLASRGSVIPLFLKQIASGGEVTITLPEMTRFLLSLDDAVDTVFEALKNGRAGEVTIPTAPSATVINLAKAMIGDRDIEIKNIGIRPGEKIHEILISEEEANHTFARGDFYAVQSMLPELSFDDKYADIGEYSSANSVISLEDTVELLRKNNLLPEQQLRDLNSSSEIIR
ncbi:MAG: polysaccharide biosynthesis protein [Pseudomonadota bacterium]